ncbi:MAG: helix-turn-helix domain-containing protein [Clostridia bacterium]|nr:helix-turn-helix domain-containing protein [Clostridia bacterium]
MKDIQWAGADTIRFEVTKTLDVLHGRPPLTFTYINSFTDLEMNHPLHIHENTELYFCISDKVDYVLGKSYLRLAPGDVVIVRAGEAHRVVLREAHRYERFFIQLPARVFPTLSHDPLHSLMHALGGGSARLRPSAEQRSAIEALLYDTLTVCREDIAEGLLALHQTKIYAKTVELLCLLNECADRVLGADGIAEDEHLPEPLADVMLYIDKNLKSIESVNEIADAVHLAPSYLSAMFRNHLGVPLVYHLQSRKMSLAKQLLEQGQSVADACLAAGYTDQSYFIRVFKRHLGVTPLKYRAAFCAGKENKPAP